MKITIAMVAGHSSLISGIALLVARCGRSNRSGTGGKVAAGSAAQRRAAGGRGGRVERRRHRWSGGGSAGTSGSAGARVRVVRARGAAAARARWRERGGNGRMAAARARAAAARAAEERRWWRRRRVRWRWRRRGRGWGHGGRGWRRRGWRSGGAAGRWRDRGRGRRRLRARVAAPRAQVAEARGGVVVAARRYRRRWRCGAAAAPGGGRDLPVPRVASATPPAGRSARASESGSTPRGTAPAAEAARGARSAASAGDCQANRGWPAAGSEMPMVTAPGARRAGYGCGPSRRRLSRPRARSAGTRRRRGARSRRRSGRAPAAPSSRRPFRPSRPPPPTGRSSSDAVAVDRRDAGGDQRLQRAAQAGQQVDDRAPPRRRPVGRPKFQPLPSSRRLSGVCGRAAACWKRARRRRCARSGPTASGRPRRSRANRGARRSGAIGMVLQRERRYARRSSAIVAAGDTPRTS